MTARDAPDAVPPDGYEAGAAGLSVDQGSDAVPEGTSAPRGWGPPGRGTLGTLVLIGLMVGVGLLAMLSVTPGPRPDRVARPEQADAVIVDGQPASWDPARILDGTSNQVLAQVYEGLTVLDADSRVRPALAERWSVEDGGRTIVFHLRPGITYSDGTPISAADVRRSWLRVLDPDDPGPLAGLLSDIRGARERVAGRAGPDEVAIEAAGDTLTVRFERPAAYFPAVAAAPTLAVVPRSIERARGRRLPDGVVASGAYVPVEQGADRIVLEANHRHWAGPPPLERVVVLDDTRGSPVEAFQDGAVDWTRIAPSDAPWIAYDRELGPRLRRSDDLSVDLVGFDTTRPPFDDARVRRAVGMAVDWRRLTALAEPDAPVATSLVPSGIDGHGEEDFLPRYDPDAARRELAAAGYPGGEGFPVVTFASYGVGEPSAVALELERELGIRVEVESRPFSEHSALLDRDPPDIWSLSWSADYPHAHDFLGLLLRSGSSANAGGWSDPRFDILIDRAAATTDPVEEARLYADAQRIVRDEVPVVPLRYGVSWWLSREGLVGASPSGVGVMRYAGMDRVDR